MRCSTLTAIMLLAIGLAYPAVAQSQPFLLKPANTIATKTHLILTVPLTDKKALDKIAREIMSRFGVTLTAEWPLKSIDVHCFVVEADPKTDMNALIARMLADKQIRTAQKMQEFKTLESRYSDPLFPIQTALKQINAVAAQRYSTGSGVHIAVVDSAIDASHPDLLGRLTPAKDFVGVGQTSVAEDHGTAIAGIIAADVANATGIVGIAPKAQLTSLRACWQAPNEQGECNSFSLARALNFALLNGYDVINLSLGGPSDPLLEEIIKAAIQKNIVVVAAWGEKEEASFPASVPGVIAAGGPTKTSIPAPSVDVISTAPHNDYRYVSGSSVAAAHISGILALLLAMHPELTTDSLANALHASIRQQDGAPMIDACAVLLREAKSPLSCK
ncbi:Subtilase family protein [Cohaesibacter marisflavi]|uniref:Subtilase family protein n=1 Tax=Cohaesibacter marisflavi TaxID=655353 RepID=A0A1I5KH80_9HYPH|nr:S8 family serine peptidase [Cohaesibacter marisflavi]SFO84394.1 Subtilase family protein [Cohaesibacter marisflavi]